jgi:hypothetical protein
MTRRNGKGDRDQDLSLALLCIEAAFGPVEVLQVRPNPRPAFQRRPESNREQAAQTVLDLDGYQQQEGGEAVA